MEIVKGEIFLPSYDLLELKRLKNDERLNLSTKAASYDRKKCCLSFSLARGNKK
jgi:hypothetical protein